MTAPLYLVLLHDQMLDKTGLEITSSLTLIDVHDIARSARTYGVKRVFIAHPSPTLRKLARTVKTHWQEGFGATYNPNRKDAISGVEVVSDLDEAIHQIDLAEETLPILVATSAKPGPDRVTFTDSRERMSAQEQPTLLMFGTGWGMTDNLIGRADYLLEPINGPTDYNHLSVRSACAIILDRLLGG